MKATRLIVLVTIIVAAVAARGATANELANGGFEADAVFGAGPVGGASGWTTFGDAATASDDMDPVRSGIGSLRLAGGGNFSVPGAFQSFPASEGQLWDFQGYMLTPSALPESITFGLLKLVWSDGANDLVPIEIEVGQQSGDAANPGIESLPLLNNTATPGEWHFTQARGVAPPGTTSVSFFALFVDQSAGTAYFDDLRAVLIPEPASVSLVVLAALGGLGLARRRR